MPTVLEAVKAHMFQAMKANRAVEKEILRVAVGEITTEAAREGRKGSDEEAQAVIRKLVKSNEESLAALDDPAKKAVLEEENRVLSAYLPQTLDVDQIVAALGGVADAVRSAASDGQATGIAMKALKGAGAAVNGKDVAAAVGRMRS